MAVGTRTEIKQGRHFERWTGASAADTALTISTDTSPSAPRRLVYVAVHYSAAPTQTGVLVTLNSGVGAAYDTVLSTGTANAQNVHYAPASEVILFANDVIDVLAPAAGGAVTSAITICTEVLSN